MTSVTDETINTTRVGQATAIGNIKNVLVQNRAVYFWFVVANQQDANAFFDFWGNNPETAVWTPDQYTGHQSGAGGFAHAVLVVGYDDTNPSNRYWIILNSWGTGPYNNRPNGLFRMKMDIDYDDYFYSPPYAYYSLYWQTLAVNFSPTPVVSTDKTTYAQGEVIHFSGTGFTPGGSVSACLSTDNDGSLLCVGEPNADSQGNAAGTMTVGTNIPVGPQKFMAVDVSTGKYSNAAQLSITSPQPPAYSAEIVSDDIPASIIASQEYVVHVTIRNTGTNVWTASAGYKLGSPGDSDPFAPARVELDPSASVGYGQSYTFTFTMTAPSSPGSYVTDWRMLRELVTWFGGTLSKTVRVTGVVATNDAAITGNDIPTTMTAGQSYAVHVTVQNMGTTTWTAAAGYKLGAVGDSDPFAPTRILLDPSDSIGSGQSKTFTFTMTAPSTAGSYVTDWRMVREFVAWFGATLTVQVTVEAAAGQYGAVITANDMPTSMIAGQTYTVHIAVQNTGTNTWTAADGYKLGAAGDVNPFGPTRILLDPSDSIATGQSKTFTFTLTAPSTPRTYTVTWRMLRELVTWFGGSSKVSVSVSSGVRNAAIVSNDMPTTMVAGQTYTVHITVQNTGTTTWTAAGNYKLGFVGDHPPFGPSRILLDGSASVAPGQQYTFTFTLTAPTTPGTYTMQYRMLQELVTWFGQSTTTTVTVQ
jgi:hypothetical protein